MTNVDQSSRIDGFDFARAIAMFGMITVNFRLYITNVPGPDWLEAAAGQIDGRAAALFVFLAGIGISLLSARSRESGNSVAIRQDRITVLKRALFLFIGGLAFRQIWEIDILHFYGVYLALAAIMLTASNRTLALVGAAASVAFICFYYVLPVQFGIPFWDTTNALTPRDIAIDLFFQGYHPVTPWLLFLAAGMIVGRLDINDTGVRKRLFWWGLSLALLAEALSFAFVGIGLLKIALDIAPALDIELLADGFGTDAYPPMPLYLAVGTGWAMAITAACLAAGSRFGGRWWFMPFVFAGQLALTAYILHGTIGIWAIEWLGLGAKHNLLWTLGYSVVFYAFIILFATLWRRWIARGPVETVMRWLTRNWKSEIAPLDRKQD
jgi:uncharacterized membrane protein YeiB